MKFTRLFVILHFQVRPPCCNPYTFTSGLFENVVYILFILLVQHLFIDTHRLFILYYYFSIKPNSAKEVYIFRPLHAPLWSHPSLSCLFENAIYIYIYSVYTNLANIAWYKTCSSILIPSSSVKKIPCSLMCFQI